VVIKVEKKQHEIPRHIAARSYNQRIEGSAQT
jgi:hypothetical protein